MSFDNILQAGFDHPCKQTCSGWKQGFERGVFEVKKIVDEFGAGGNIDHFGVLSDRIEGLIEKDKKK